MSETIKIRSVKSLVRAVNFEGKSLLSINDLTNDQIYGLFELGVALEPWNRSFEVTRAVIAAQSLFAGGEVDRAYFLLLPYTRWVRGDALFRETYREVVGAKWILDARKAHLQHAREKEDGALDSGDVLR